MTFFRKSKEPEYFRYSTEKKVDFYYNIFIKESFNNSSLNFSKFEDDIKSLILKQLDSFEFSRSFCQVKRDRTLLSLSKIKSELGHLTGFWIDWEWIIHHIEVDFKEIGRALNILDNSANKKVFIYKNLPKKYYDFAEKIYLKDTLLREPIIFDLKEIIFNGHGLYRHPKKIIPIVGVTLWKGFDNKYWDLTYFNQFNKNQIWNAEKGCFDYQYSTKEHKWSKTVIKITIGDKTYYTH